MTAQVRETAAGKSISAFVILNPKGRHVATVQAHYSNGGTVTVDAWNIGDDAARRSAIAMGNALDDAGRIASGKHAGEYPSKVAGLQQGRAGGGGYDKFTAALSGMVIDGHALSNYCGVSRKPPKGRKTWPRDAKAPRGFGFSNYQTFTYGPAPDYARIPLPEAEQGYSSCYRKEGFKYLEAFGYTVIQAI